MLPTSQTPAHKQREQHSEHKRADTDGHGLVARDRRQPPRRVGVADPLQAAGEDVLVIGERELEDEVERLRAAQPWRYRFEDTVLFRRGLDFLLACGHRQLGILDRFARGEVVQEDGEALLARNDTNKLVVRRDRNHARSDRKVEWRRLVVIVALVGRAP